MAGNRRCPGADGRWAERRVLRRGLATVALLTLGVACAFAAETGTQATKDQAAKSATKAAATEAKAGTDASTAAKSQASSTQEGKATPAASAATPAKEARTADAKSAAPTPTKGESQDAKAQAGAKAEAASGTAVAKAKAAATPAKPSVSQAAAPAKSKTTKAAAPTKASASKAAAAAPKKAARKAPAAGSEAVASAKPQEDRVTYHYNALGRRDPFKALVDGFIAANEGGNAPPDIGGLKVVGIVWGADDKFALVEDPRGNSMVLRRGDKVMNGVVEGLKRESMIVKITVDGQSQSVEIPLMRKGEDYANQ